MRLLPLLLASLVPFAAACGKEREPAPPIFAVSAPEGELPAEFPEAGVTLAHPRNWFLRHREPPGVFELQSGEATVAGWAYPREEELPQTDAQLEAARERLLDAVEEREPSYRVRSSATTRVAGSPAITLTGDQVISRRRVRTRSVHVFKGEVEYVFEAIARPRDYRLVERRVLRPLLRSLRLTGEAPAPAREDAEE